MGVGKVTIILGSKSDIPYAEECVKILREFNIRYEVKIISAHRTPELLEEFLKNDNSDLYIAGAGYAAHLPGVVASKTLKPVIGIPLDTSPLMGGLDALLSIVQMPPGIPVATVTVGKAGGINAGILAVQILSLKYPELVKKLEEYRNKMKEKIKKANEELNL
ncbi:MAG: 5-(carboxyamino)imidazole ribonucleotide mutase [Gammaproteobacteria bacterium]|nr:MAG: 5-(carboxyamino)imidazole ribonucleotide mutase [Gammaproteobacteria bacterium]RTZ69886.1 MAG: 5-(carboxyamino)imidazole ribonucleotide mutase [Aquificaceae bacterium]